MFYVKFLWQTNGAKFPQLGKSPAQQAPTLPVLGGETTQTASGTKRTNPDRARQAMIQLKLKQC